jgi:hypothetical protein
MLLGLIGDLGRTKRSMEKTGEAQHDVARHEQSARTGMKNYALALGVLLAGVALGRAWQRSEEPQCHGRSISQWARHLTAHPVGQDRILAELGPALVPYLIRDLDTFGLGSTDLIYGPWCLLYTRAPNCVRTVLPEPILQSERRLNAVILLGRLGDGAKGAVPRLIDLLTDEQIRGSVVLTLAAIGPAAKPAMHELLAILEEEPQAFILSAVMKINPDWAELEPVLLRCQTNGPLWLRREADYALGRGRP